jgi:DNA-binding NarL/FixJ family response regulator
MRLLAAGNTNRQIASRLALSEGTVRTHTENIFRRLQVTNRLAAVARAFPPGTASALTTPREDFDRVHPREAPRLISR